MMKINLSRPLIPFVVPVFWNNGMLPLATTMTWIYIPLILRWTINCFDCTGHIGLHGQSGYVSLMESEAFEFKSYYYYDFRLYFTLLSIVSFLGHNQMKRWISTQWLCETVATTDFFFYNTLFSITFIVQSLKSHLNFQWTNNISKSSIEKQKEMRVFSNCSKCNMHVFISKSYAHFRMCICNKSYIHSYMHLHLYFYLCPHYMPIHSSLWSQWRYCVSHLYQFF